MSKPISNSPTDNLNISISMSVLARLSRYCINSPERLTKSQVVEMALKAHLAAEMARDPAFWEAVYDKYEADSEL